MNRINQRANRKKKTTENKNKYKKSLQILQLIKEGNNPNMATKRKPQKTKWISVNSVNRAGYSSCVNNVIARRSSVNKRKHVTWVTTGIRSVVKLYIHGPQKIRGVL